MTKQRKADQRLVFVVVASTAPGHYPHPVEIALHPDGARSRISFSIGPHAANAGGQLPLANVLDGTGLSPLFDTEFDAAELHWLVPYLVRLQGGEDVTEEIVAGYVERHGKRPRWTEQARHGD
ncbi:hypothetical protein ABFT23_04815 [Nocardioides sp. C4-1]|uniref:hypothetical protein n=1 Tax=Nocardioides sp. C4-1 TaxID=3151851 RepID=UPI003266AFB1